MAPEEMRMKSSVGGLGLAIYTVSWVWGSLFAVEWVFYGERRLKASLDVVAPFESVAETT